MTEEEPVSVPRSKQPDDQLAVGGGKVEFVHLAPGDPADLLVLECARDRAGLRRTGQERQADRLFGIVVNDGIEIAIDVNFEIELFAAFPAERLLGRFARVDLAAHEFPFSALRFRRGALSDEVSVTLTDNRPDDLDDVSFAFHDLVRILYYFRGQKRRPTGRWVAVLNEAFVSQTSLTSFPSSPSSLCIPPSLPHMRPSFLRIPPSSPHRPLPSPSSSHRASPSSLLAWPFSVLLSSPSSGPASTSRAPPTPQRPSPWPP